MPEKLKKSRKFSSLAGFLSCALFFSENKGLVHHDKDLEETWKVRVFLVQMKPFKQGYECAFGRDL